MIRRPGLFAGIDILSQQVRFKALPISPADRIVPQLIDDENQLGLEECVYIFFQRIVHPDASSTVLHPTGAFQIGKVTGDRGLRHVQSVHEVTDTVFVTSLKENEQAESGFFGQ